MLDTELFNVELRNSRKGKGKNRDDLSDFFLIS